MSLIFLIARGALPSALGRAGETAPVGHDERRGDADPPAAPEAAEDAADGSS